MEELVDKRKPALGAIYEELTGLEIDPATNKFTGNPILNVKEKEVIVFGGKFDPSFA